MRAHSNPKRLPETFLSHARVQVIGTCAIRRPWRLRPRAHDRVIFVCLERGLQLPCLRRRKADRKGYRLSAPETKPVAEYSAMDKRISLRPSRRACLSLLPGVMAAWSPSALAEDSKSAFDQWVAAFRARARARGISDATYTRVMADVEPDTRVLDLNREQPEFNEQLWQYLNRRVSDYRITTGKAKAKEYASLLSRVEKDYGVDRFILLAIWGIQRSIAGTASRRRA